MEKFLQLHIYNVYSYSYIIHKTWVLQIYRTRNANLNYLIDS